MIRLFSLLIFLTIVIAAMMSLKPDGTRSTETVKGLPWQIEALPEGRSKVFGVTLGQSTLGDAHAQLGDDMTLAIIVASGQDTGGLEMFYSRYKAGVFSGKLVLAADLAAETVAQMLERSIKFDYMDSGAKKFTLHPEDLPVALRTPLATLTFIPTVKIDEPSAIERFGSPAEIIRPNEQVTHLLYPDKGLDLIINKDGREVLQYVAPRDFERLRKPLLQ
jgi:hypothetical protein